MLNAKHRAELPKAWREDVQAALECLRRGGVVIYPTDTIWGIGCDATNAEAVRRVFQIKQRAEAKALIVLTDSQERLARYVSGVPDVAWDMMELATRPLTLVLDGAHGLAPELLSEDGSVGIRITQEPLSNELCFRLMRPIVSTSANISGEPAPRCFDEISPALLEQADYVCRSRRGGSKGGPARPSSVVKLTRSGEVTILR